MWIVGSVFSRIYWDQFALKSILEILKSDTVYLHQTMLLSLYTLYIDRIDMKIIYIYIVTRDCWDGRYGHENC